MGVEIDLRGKYSPYPVVYVIGHVEKMEPGDSMSFRVDDPLALKSIPQELEEFPDVALDIQAAGSNWLLTVKKDSGQ